ncbi:succinylglutamate desuccinylase/aspartoacylase family protein [Yeosuana sp. MJ-SS3]|uniref:Succinylglutamate desuccinylase/aspartoacylase family protein n=1 Tax=Gilvirhabdus luticola TaxID=3079858 RepID=A0ABU3U2T7_9FLAO|nr:succinylglutamate desuccinylase/aspartoacylase family protein [Yeosuana sp. MJ-SS3]MDU8884705.1 succinylglutamate desuccinylase/aspartoacylase family protein [Yeosuana sp. MJ-SS3]
MGQTANTESKAQTSTSRIIAKIKGKEKGPTIVFISGIHGNEKAGVTALQQTLNEINTENVKGTIYGLAGNISALKQNKRYVEKDLNRLWTKSYLYFLNRRDTLTVEQKELKELLSLLKEIIATENSPFYFIDLHTTSSKTLPFITINDALINRKFAKQFPVPIVLGIEEFLQGPLLSYINELGYVSLGFESGQHEDIKAIENAKAFIKLALVFSNNVVKESVSVSDCFNKLKKASNKTSEFFEVIYLHQIKPDESFKMINGFESFQKIKKGTLLAKSNNEIIKSKKKGKLFMPLYQDIGEEGFFIIRRISPFVLKLSKILRNLKADSLLVLLPGVSWQDKNKQTLEVDLKTAKFLAKQIFHLFGYRSRQIDETHIKFFSRERAAKTSIYKNEKWY